MTLKPQRPRHGRSRRIEPSRAAAAHRQHITTDKIPANHICHWCGAPRTRWNPDQDPSVAQYACGTTTVMMRDDFHINGPTVADRRREVVTWRARLAAQGRSDADPFV